MLTEIRIWPQLRSAVALLASAAFPRPFQHNLEALAAGAHCAGEFNHCH